MNIRKTLTLSLIKNPYVQKLTTGKQAVSVSVQLGNKSRKTMRIPRYNLGTGIVNESRKNGLLWIFGSEKKYK